MKIAKILILLGFTVLLCAVLSLGFLFVLSDGDIIGYVRTTYLRIVLASREDDLAAYAGTDTTERIFTVESGDSPTVIAQKLYEEKLIIEPELFLDYIVVEGIDRKLEAGTYFLTQQQTIPEIAYLLTDSRNSSISFRVVEGSRLEEIAESIDSNRRFQFSGAGFLSVTGGGSQIDPALSDLLGIPQGASLEGFMFPDTYVLSPSITALELRDTLLQNFVDQLTPPMLQAAEADGFTMREIVSLASIIERESVWDDENPMIASVYRNRLEIGMTLDADPTVQYSLGGTRNGQWWPQITLGDYRSVTSPYNTYLNYGLPPSPIANPSLSAIMAAIYPAESNYFFFRARCDGSNYHVFAPNFEQHLANGC